MSRKSKVEAVVIEAICVLVTGVFLYGIAYVMSLITPFPLDLSSKMATVVFVLFVVTVIVIDVHGEMEYKKWEKEYEEEEKDLWEM